MSYIYKITNKINGKMYVGNTAYNIKKRWGEHVFDSRKLRCQARPLYVDMTKYGINNFEISVIEECDKSISNKREEFWIKKLDTYHNGYNCTLGGRGKPSIDYSKLERTYKQTKSIKVTAELLGIGVDAVSQYLHNSNENLPSKRDIAKINGRTKPVAIVSSDGVVTQSFESPYDAALWVMKSRDDLKSVASVKVNITKACTGKFKQAYGFKWKYV